MARPSRLSSVDTRTQQLFQLWSLRILAVMGRYAEIMSPQGCEEELLAHELGIERLCQGRNKGLDYAFKIVSDRYDEVERASPLIPSESQLRDNILKLRDALGLSEPECMLLEFIVLLRSESLFREVTNLLGDFSTRKLVESLSTILGVSKAEVRQILHKDAPLIRSGLVRITLARGYSLGGDLDNVFDLLNSEIADQLQDDLPSVNKLIQNVISRSIPPTLTLSEYGHIKSDLDILVPYLRNCLVEKRKGVNVFIYGLPGTGKTELIRALSKSMDGTLMEVAIESKNGEILESEQRLRHLSAAQAFCLGERTLLLMDEAEDIFDDGDVLFGSKSTAQTHKAWINRLLETNSAPTFWVSNSVECLDPAFVRRFDMVIELPIPPKSHRRTIVARICGTMVNEDATLNLAGSEYLAPAVLGRAANVARVIRSEAPASDSPSVIQHLVRSTLVAQGHRDIPDRSSVPAVDFDARFISTDADLTSITNGIRRNGAAKLCLYGPPGTGKSAFGHWLADQLGRPLHIKTASQLIDSYVGGTEKLIAAAFRNASREKAVLVIDEVDSFLSDRRNAVRGWEVTQVNEMLVQIESFSGILVASTNLMEGLDPAAMRRFDMKIRFGYLKPQQAKTLSEKYCVSLGLPTPTNEQVARLLRLTFLTPGDFAAVARRHRFNPLHTTDEFTACLLEECLHKEDGQRRAVGFV